jgi:hypothetical protein
MLAHGYNLTSHFHGVPQCASASAPPLSS